jgi:2',3'-cyclic-nucleotide 2'-phosphodiesterase (5'-nucleotidase family)
MAAPPVAVVTILHTNDIHGDLAPFVVDTGDATAQTGDRGRPYQEYPRAGTIGGFARLAGAVAAIRRERGAANVLLVDAGDTFGDGLLANLTRGAATLRLMDALGYNFMALGNHDYEYTAARTRALQDSVRFPMRAANAVVRETGEPFLGDPTVVRTVAGVRIGLLALTYHNTDQTGNKDNTRALRFESGIDAARRWVPALRRRADVVVVVSHQGTVVDSLLAARVPGIDLIVGGHSHDRIQPPRRIAGTDTWMVQALSDASALGELTFNVRAGRVTDVRGVVHELYADRYAEDPHFARLLDDLRAPFLDTLESMVATAAERIGRQYKSESPVDRLAAELLRRYANADAAFLPGLGFGVTWQPGPVTREMLFEMFPHPTPVVRETMTGAQILAVLEQSATNLRPVDDMDRVGGLVQTAGVRWTVDFTRPVGRRVGDVSIGGAAVDVARPYRVVTNGGMLQGTHRYTSFAEGKDITRESVPMVVALEQAMRAMSTLRAPAGGDVTIHR